MGMGPPWHKAAGGSSHCLESGGLCARGPTPYGRSSMRSSPTKCPLEAAVFAKTVTTS